MTETIIRGFPNKEWYTINRLPNINKEIFVLIDIDSNGEFDPPEVVLVFVDNDGNWNIKNEDDTVNNYSLAQNWRVLWRYKK